MPENPPASGHYNPKNDPIQFMEDNFDFEQVVGFYRGNILKYVTRYDRKNGLEDLGKARWYLDKLIEKLESQEPR